MSAVGEGVPVRTPSPLGRRLDRRRGYLPILRAAQDALEGIANVNYSVTASITWETATDWDNSVSESGVVHENYGTRSADQIELGYPTVDRNGSSLIEFWSMEDATGPLEGHVGGNDATVNGPVLQNAVGPFGKSYPTWDATDDNAAIANAETFLPATDITMVWWQKVDALQKQSTFFWQGASGSNRLNTHAPWDDGTWYWDVGDTGADGRLTATWQSAWTDTWACFVAVSEAGVGQTLYRNGTEISSDANTATLDTTESGTLYFGFDDADSAYYGGEIAQLQMYGRPFTQSQAQAAYDAATGGSLTTATKSFGSTFQPDLTGLDYDLNGESITIDVIGSPGTASEEIVSQALGGATSYTLTWSNSHQDFRVMPKLSTAGVTNTTPTVRSISLSA